MFQVIFKTRLLEIAQISFVGLMGILYSSDTATDFHFFRIVWLVSLSAQIATAFFMNDLFDWEADLKNPRKAGSLSKKNLKIFIVTGIIVSLAGASLISSEQLLFVIAFHLAGYLYSCPPFRWKEKLGAPMTGHFIVGILYSISSTGLGRPQYEIFDFLWAAFWGLIFASASLGNELVDKKSDLMAGFQTLGNTFSEQTVRSAIFVLQVSSISVLFLIHFSLGSTVNLAFILFTLLMLSIVFFNFYRSDLHYRQWFRGLFAVMLLVSLFTRIFKRGF